MTPLAATRRSTSVRFCLLIALLAFLGASFSYVLQAQDNSNTLNFTRLRTGDPTFDRGASGASWVDFDNDGDLDLFATGIPGSTPPIHRLFLYRNEGKDVFKKVVVDGFADFPGEAIGQSWADYDNDGDLDVIVTGNPSSFLFQNEGNEKFSKVTTGDFANSDNRGWSPAWGDYDGDGNLDLFITHPAGFTGTPAISNHLFHNDGPPRYTLTRVDSLPMTQELGPFTNASWSDYDQDGDIDLFITAGPADGTLGPDFYYRNLLKETGKPNFERITKINFADELRDGQVANWVDYDNDEDLDLFVTSYGATQRGLPNDLYRNDQVKFTKITTGEIVTDRDVSLANAWGDFDNDGDLDVFVANDIANRLNKLYLNNGDGSFTAVTTGPLTSDRAANWAATIGDYDNDGDLDLFVPVFFVTGAQHFLYRNDLSGGKAWLKLRLVGTISNRSAIGAKVRAKATINGKSVTQLREVSSQNSFMGQNALEVHFGLGDAKTIESLIIEWPSGQKDELKNLAVSQILSITETKK